MGKNCLNPPLMIQVRETVEISSFDESAKLQTQAGNRLR